MTEFSSRMKTVEKHTTALEDAFRRCETDRLEAIRERDCALAEMRTTPLAINPDATPISAEGLVAIGFTLDGKSGEHRMNIGRLYLSVREDCSWCLDFVGTYGGRIGSYRKLQGIEEVRQLVHLLGVHPKETAKS